MKIEHLSKKQGEIFKFIADDHSALICDGAVRSGKTLAMSVAFLIWAMSHFDRCNFAICAKTVTNAERNIVKPLQMVEGLPYRMVYRISNRMLTVRCGGIENYFYLFGGKDESSYMLIQGITLAGVFLDEVALMPQSFADQAIARTLTYSNAKKWFNCNPESPMHWFYIDWLKPVQDGKRPDVKHLHFLMTDNPTVDDAALAKAKEQFNGVFYDRYIRGLWVKAEGLIYPMFNQEFHVKPVEPRPYDLYYISCDYGTANPMSMGLWGRANDLWYRIREYYWDSRDKHETKTDEEYYVELEALAGNLPIEYVIVDPSAASFITCIKRHDRFDVLQADNDVVNGIRQVATYLKSGRLFINECCADCIREFGLYTWDEKSGTDKPIKENDHAMDDVRYFVHTAIREDD